MMDQNGMRPGKWIPVKKFQFIAKMLRTWNEIHGASGAGHLLIIVHFIAENLWIEQFEILTRTEFWPRLWL